MKLSYLLITELLVYGLCSSKVQYVSTECLELYFPTRTQRGMFVCLYATLTALREIVNDPKNRKK